MAKSSGTPQRLGRKETNVHRGASWITIIVGIFTLVVAFGSMMATIAYGYRKLEEQLARIEVLDGKVSELQHQIDALPKLDDSQTTYWEGVWSGKWDNEWPVRFTIIHTNENKFIVVYEHEEDIGKSFEYKIHLGKLNGQILNVDDYIYIKRQQNGEMQAAGTFNNSKWRSADLKKNN